MSRPQKRRFQNYDEKKEKYNSTISSSIADIIRYSLDDQFRSKCFQLMQVNNTNDFQLAIKDKLDAIINPSSGTSPTLQKRRSFHDEDDEGSLIYPDRNGMTPQVDVEKQTDKNNEMMNSPTENITDSHIDEISKILKITNIVMEENIEGKDMLPRTVEAGSKTYLETGGIKKVIKVITPHNVNCHKDDLSEDKDGFWLTEECCLWDPHNKQEHEAALLQEEINENDTDW